MADAMPGALWRVDEGALRAFTEAVLRCAGLREADAAVTAAVLVASDVRGIASHGVARLAYYLAMIEAGSIDPTAESSIVRQSATTALIDAGNGMGHPVGERAMRLAIEKAAAHDLGMVTVRHSNHYGIAGYYAMLALDHEMIGISLTNAPPLVAATGARVPVYGTNPIAIAVPAAGGAPFVLDMATSVVPRGRLEVSVRRGTALAEGWALDVRGQPTVEPEAALLGALLPLGGPSITSGYKGYGLALAIEILSAVLPGSLYGPRVHPIRDAVGVSDLGQFFMAIRIAAFDEPAAFMARVSDLLRLVKDSPRAEEDVEILVAGEKEWRAAEAARRDGVPIDVSVALTLEGMATRYGIASPFARR